MRYVMGIDLGTSGTKCVLYDEYGKEVVQTTENYPLYQPKNGWAEQEPEDWYQAVVSGMKKCLKLFTGSADQIVSIGLSGQMHGLVMLDENGECLRRSIIWCDQRTHLECKEIETRIGRNKLISITFNPALTGFTLSKILWVKKHEPELFAKCKHILLPKDYIRYRLTGTFVTDASDASGMQLLNVGKREWSQEIMDAFSLDLSLFAQVMESPEISGQITHQASAETGLLPGTLVAAGAGDNAASALGSGVVDDGDAFCTIGTSGVVYAHTNTPKLDPKGRIHTFCCAVPNQWHVMGVTQAAGLSMQWLRNQLYPDDMEYEQINKDIESLPIGANRLMYLPYLMGERTPHLDSHCRGAFVGLSAIHNKKDLARAVMEGVSYSLKDCLDVLDEMDVHPHNIVLCGGGSKSGVWRQMLSDLFFINVSILQTADNAALGAAILAMAAAGIYPDVQTACSRIVKTAHFVAPNKERHQTYKAYHQVYKGLYTALKDSFHKLSEL